MKTILIQMSDPSWTTQAMHLASALARSVRGQLVLVHLVPESNPGLLGWRIVPPSPNTLHQIELYAGIAEDYGVQFLLQPVQFVDLDDALAQVAGLLGAASLFAHIPRHRINLIRRFRLWRLKRHLGDCRLHTLDDGQIVTVRAPLPDAARTAEAAAH